MVLLAAATVIVFPAWWIVAGGAMTLLLAAAVVYWIHAEGAAGQKRDVPARPTESPDEHSPQASDDPRGKDGG